VPDNLIKVASSSSESLNKVLDPVSEPANGVLKPEPEPARPAPVSKLTHGLLSTYQGINTSFYRNKTKRLKANPPEDKTAVTADAKGHFIFKAGEMLNGRYKVVRELGKGSFGIVLHCEDTETNRRSVAIKVIRAKFAFLVQSQNEIRLLQELAGIMKVRDPHTRSIVLLEGHFMHGEHQCLVFERLQCNLYERLHATNFKGVRLCFLRQIGAKLLDALDVLASLPDPIIHADIKPENVLCTAGYDVQLADFGSACRESSSRHASYIQSRFYRSPEVLLGLEYGTPVDMWSFACMLMEMYTGRVLFHGDSSATQFSSIRKLCGMPPESMLKHVDEEKRKTLFGDPKLPVPSITFADAPESSTKLRSILAAVCARLLPENRSPEEMSDERELLDVLVKLLVYDPAARLTPNEARALPFFQPGLQQLAHTAAKARAVSASMAAKTSA
jgi:serine/threonine protein kinase